jgi:hypothetical protein
LSDVGILANETSHGINFVIQSNDYSWRAFSSLPAPQNAGKTNKNKQDVSNSIPINWTSSDP